MRRTAHPALVFRRMGSADRSDVFALLGELLKKDAYYRHSSLAYGAPQDAADADAALGEALTLWIDRPDYGFVWLALEDDRALACAAVSYAISASVGKVVAKLDPEILAHLEWIGFVRPTGLVVSAPALVRAGAILDRRDTEGQRLLRVCLNGSRKSYGIRERAQRWASCNRKSVWSKPSRCNR